MRTEQYRSSAEDVLSFIDNSPSCYHVVDNLKKQLITDGFTELHEGSDWNILPGGGYFVIRGGASILAFRVPEEVNFASGNNEKQITGFHVIASHSDSPSFKIKENPELSAAGYVKLNIEKYGGMLCAPWFDRPLSAAGRILVREKNGNRTALKTRLVDFNRDLLMIPSVAIHMDRTANDGHKYNAQIDMLPLLGEFGFTGNENANAMNPVEGTGTKPAQSIIKRIAAEAAEVRPEEIVSMDLFLYNRMRSSIWGMQEEFISAPKLDDLACVRTSFNGFMRSTGAQNSISMCCVFDNEEVGSGTRQGAASTFLADVMHRICSSLGGDENAYRRSIAQSFLVSADNGHAVHPNYPGKSDPINRPRMNGGIVIKHSANQKYTTDAVSEAICCEICENAEIPYQIFTNRADMAGGSTLGNLSAVQVPILSVDIGLAQLAMHSPYETAGVMDPMWMEKFAEAFYNTNLQLENDMWIVEQ